MVNSFEAQQQHSILQLISLSKKPDNMSSSCGNCDCADKSQCGKGNNYGMTIVETQKSFVETVVMDAPAAEHGCKCGSNCTCTDCTCGH